MSSTFGFVDNTGPNTVEATIKNLCSRARRLDAVVAFATKAGVNAVLPYLLQVATNGQVRLSVGLYQGITEPSALRALLRASKMGGGSLSVTVSRNATLHRKVYVFTTPQRLVVLVGSSNLTLEGLRSEGEFNVVVQMPRSNGSMKLLRQSLPDLYSPTASVPLNDPLISKYERLRAKSRGSGISRGALAKLLNVSTSTARRHGVGGRAKMQRWLRDYVAGFASQRTQQIVYEQTGWDRRGWSCYVVPPDRFIEGDRVLLFDFSSRPAWARVVAIKAVTRTAVQTGDGRHFAAYTELRRHFRRRKVTKEFWRELNAAGLQLDSHRSKQTRVLSRAGVSAVESTLRRR